MPIVDACQFRLRRLLTPLALRAHSFYMYVVLVQSISEYVLLPVYTKISLAECALNLKSNVMKKQRRFIQCDVFTPQPTKGNALAVVLDAQGFSEEAMRHFAAWTNLAETTFLFPPETEDGDYRVRILTPTREMPFAGHPTLGSCAAWLHAGGKPRQHGIVRQECGVGTVEINTGKPVPAFFAPPTAISEMPAKKFTELTTKLGVNPDHVVRYSVLNNGPEWHAFELQSAAQVLAVDSSTVRWPAEKAIGLIGPHVEGSECDFEVRMLAPSSGMIEDPITGLLNSALAHWRLHNNELNEDLLIAQGTSINRKGRVYISRGSDEQGSDKQPDVFIGGETHILVEGTVYL